MSNAKTVPGVRELLLVSALALTFLAGSRVAATQEPASTPAPAGLLAEGVYVPAGQQSGVRTPGLRAPGLRAPGLRAPGLRAPGLRAPGTMHDGPSGK